MTADAPRDAYGEWYAALAAKLDAYSAKTARKARAAAESASLIRASLEAR